MAMSPIRPELGRQDWSPVARGGQAFGQGVGQGLASLGASVGKAMDQRKAMKAEVKATKDLLSNPVMQQFAGTMGISPEQLEDMKTRFEDGSLSEQAAVARSVNRTLGMVMQVGGNVMSQKPVQQPALEPVVMALSQARDPETGIVDPVKAYEIGVKLNADPKLLDQALDNVRPRQPLIAEGDEPTPFERKLGEQAASVYSDWQIDGGRERAVSNVEKFEDIIERLASGDATTRNVVDFLPVVADDVRAIINPSASDVIDRIRGVAFQTLRETLGAQFTEREGQRLVESYFNPKLSEDANIARLQDFVDVNKQVIEAKDRFVKYAEEKGTVRGFKGGRSWNVQDVENQLNFNQPPEPQPDIPVEDDFVIPGLSGAAQKALGGYGG